LNDKGQTVYVTEQQLDVILEKQRKGLEELRGIWENKDDSFFDIETTRDHIRSDF
jgi:DNA primase large subunit